MDETDPRDTEVASWANEEPAVLQPLPALGTESRSQEDLDDRRQSPIPPENMPPVLREETDETRTGPREHTPSRRFEVPKGQAVATDVDMTGDQTDTSGSVGGNETDNEDNDMDVESTVIPTVTSGWPSDDGHAESFAKGLDSTAPTSELEIPQHTNLSDDQEAFGNAPEPIQPDSTSAIQSQYIATYGPETGYLGDDEMLLETEATGTSSRAIAVEMDAPSEGKATRSVQPEAGSPEPVLDNQQVGLDVTSVAGHASESASAMIFNNDLDAAPLDSETGIALLTEENLAHLPEPTEAIGGAVQHSHVGIENASNESLVDVDMGHEAPSDRLVSALRAVPEIKEGDSLGVSPVNGEIARSSLAEESVLAAGPSIEGDDPATSPLNDQDEQSPLTDVIAPGEATPQETEDMFELTDIGDSEQQDQAGISDVISTTVRALPAADMLPEALEPHLPIDTHDPALALQPVVLHEHQYRSTGHPDHAAEMAQVERENHLHAFEEVAQAIREDTPSDAADTENVDTAQQSNTASIDAESRSASPSPSGSTGNSNALTFAPEDVGNFRPRQLTPGIHPEVEQEVFTRETASNDGESDQVEQDEDNIANPIEIADQRSILSDSAMQTVESPATPGPTTESQVVENEEQVGRAEAERDSTDSHPVDGVEISIVRVHEYPTATRAPRFASTEPEFAPADLSENEMDQTSRPASPTTLGNIDENTESSTRPPVVGPAKAHPRIQDSVPAPSIPMDTPGYASRHNDPLCTPSPRPAQSEVAVASPDVRHHHHGSGARPTRPISHLMSNTESPASHTRSHCVYHKLEFDEGVHSHTLLIPGCSLGTAEQRSDAGARDLGEASNEEMKLKQDLLFGENFTQQMRSEEEGTLPSDLEHRLSLIVGREIIREGHCYILPIAPGVPHSHPHEVDVDEVEEEDGGIASRTRRRTSRTPGPTSGTAPVTPARDGQKRRRSRGPSASRTPASSSKRKMPDLSNVEEAGEEADNGTRDADHDDEEETERSTKKRIIDVDGSPQAVGTLPHERSRDEEDGDRMDIDERVDVEHAATGQPAGTRKGWFGWLWGKS